LNRRLYCTTSKLLRALLKMSADITNVATDDALVNLTSPLLRMLGHTMKSLASVCKIMMHLGCKVPY